MSADGGSYLIHDNRVDLVFFFYFLCHIICIVFTVSMTDKDGMAIGVITFIFSFALSGLLNKITERDVLEF